MKLTVVFIVTFPILSEAELFIYLEAFMKCLFVFFAYFIVGGLSYLLDFKIILDAYLMSIIHIESVFLSIVLNFHSKLILVTNIMF